MNILNLCRGGVTLPRTGRQARHPIKVCSAIRYLGQAWQPAPAIILALLLAALVTPAWSATDCSPTNVRCVGPGQEYTTIQAAHNVAVAADSVVVFDGNYRGFEINRSGSQGNPITFKADGSNVVINSAISGMSSKCNGDAGICLKGNGDLQGVHDIVIQGFIITGLYRCISSHDASPETTMTSEYPHKRITIRDNICTNSGHEGLYLSELYDSLVEGNTISGTASDGTQRGHGIYLANAGSDNTIIRGNTISNTKQPDSAGIHFNGDASVGGDGIISGLTIENNIIYGGQQNGLNMDGVDNSIIRNNLIYGNATNAVRGYAIDASQGPANMEVINNTLIVPSGSSDWALRFSEDRGGHVIFNNILIKEGSGGGSICVGNTNFQSDYNVVGDRFSRNDESSTINLTSWRTSGQDVHSLSATSTALFQNASGSDYHLKAGASAIDLGIAAFASANAPTSDQASAIRPQGSGYDAGAYEYGSGPAFSCDLTGDTVVNAIDLQRLVNDILKGTTAGNEDLNHDTAVNVNDLQVLVNIILGIRGCL